MRGEYKVKNETLRELVDDADALAAGLEGHATPPSAASTTSWPTVS